MTSAADGNPRVYVACLVAYNNGYLHGAWIDTDQDADEIRNEIAAMLARSPTKDAEEYAIHDYEGFSRASPSRNTPALRGWHGWARSLPSMAR